MEFSLMHAGLAAGAALAAIPVLLHLFMRPTPKHVVFPALRLIRERQKRSKKKMRIKNWLLLAARMLLLALMALALARPRLHSQTPLGDDSVPTAMGLVFDTSLSMSYKQNDKTLLDQAKERALELIDRVPDSSLIFAADSASPASKAGRSPASARQWIKELTVRAVNRPLNVAMGEVYDAVLECDRPRREVYVLSDLAKTSWDVSRPAEGLDKVAKAAEKPGGKVATVVLRLGPAAAERQNVSIDEIAIPSGVASTGDPVEVRGLVRSHGAKPASRIVEFHLDGVKKGQKPVEVPAGGQVEVQFLTPPRLKEGEVHRAELRVVGAPDPLAFDDVRFLSFQARPPLKVLIASDLDVDAEFVALALDPDPGASRAYQVERARASELAAKYRDTLKDFAAVFLLDVRELDPTAWGLLNAYVHEGGGLVVGAGPRCLAENYNGPIPAQLLPAQLDAPVATAPKTATFGQVADVTHPLFGRYAEEIDPQLAVMPVYKYWRLKTAEAGRTLMTFADGAPALVERTFQGARAGRVLLWTTPLARRPRRSDPAAWNELPNLSYWVFPVVMNLTVPYLAGSTGEKLVFEAGDDVTLSMAPGAASDVRIIGPDGKTAEAATPPPPGEPLRIAAPQFLGHWTVVATGPGDAKKTLGFSLNPTVDESTFSELEKTDLDALLGKDGYALAVDDKTFNRVTDLIRVGHEIFPWIMFLILILVTAENYLANTFYKEPTGGPAPGPSPDAAQAAA